MQPGSGFALARGRDGWGGGDCAGSASMLGGGATGLYLCDAALRLFDRATVPVGVCLTLPMKSQVRRARIT